jgi:hypothetical protein
VKRALNLRLLNFELKRNAPVGVIGPGSRKLGVTGVILRLTRKARTNIERLEDVPRGTG